MEQIAKNRTENFNGTFLIWCIVFPVISFMGTLLLANYFTQGHPGEVITRKSLAAFLKYYEENHMTEFLTIFVNNSFSALVLVYFTPFILFVRRRWEKLRNYSIQLSGFEKLLLYSFPVMFLVREAVRIAMLVNGLSLQINKSLVLTFSGMLLPHGLPELIAFSVAGAFGMEVTKHCLTEPSFERAVGSRKIVLLIVTIGLCAYLEVSFTPRVFAILMSATGLG